MVSNMPRSCESHQVKSVLGEVAVDVGSRLAVDLNLAILLVEKCRLQLVPIPFGQRDFTTQPDVGGVSLGPDRGARRVTRTKAGFALFPRKVIEFQLEPVLAGPHQVGR